MDPTDIGFLKAVVAFVLVAGTCLSAARLWLRARARPLPELDRIVESLRAENAELHAELGARMAELEERVDFAERRLIQEREGTRLPPTPLRTPV
jgi:hypothetical protein